MSQIIRLTVRTEYLMYLIKYFVFYSIIRIYNQIIRLFVQIMTLSPSCYTIWAETRQYTNLETANCGQLSACRVGIYTEMIKVKFRINTWKPDNCKIKTHRNRSASFGNRPISSLPKRKFGRVNLKCTVFCIVDRRI